MKTQKKFCYEYPHPAFAVDLLIFTWQEFELKILLIERAANPFEGSWALPGGFVDENESAILAAKRELLEETNLQIDTLTQFYLASDPGRDPRGWTVSSSFIGYVGKKFSTAVAGDDARNLDWFSVQKLPKLAFDHEKIIANSIKYIKGISRLTFFGEEILPKKFKLAELNSLYQQIENSEDDAELLINRLILSNAISKVDSDYFEFIPGVCSIIKESGFGL